MAQEAYIQFRQYRNSRNLKEYWSDAAPSLVTDVGPYNLGDVVWNITPAGGGATYVGWICTSAGADGSTSTWKGFGLIQA